MKISCIGSGYVGLVTGSCLADLGHSVICCDIDESKVKMLQQGKLSLYEPGLKEVIERTRLKEKLTFTTNICLAIENSEVIFNCVGTPSNEDGSANLQQVFAVAEAVATYAKRYQILANKSTVSPGTAQRMQELIKEKNIHSMIDVVSNPEFLKEGNAVHDFTHPDKIVIGTPSKKALKVMREVYSGLNRPYLNIIETDWATAEIMKYANNAFLATKISFINEIANICDKIGGDIKIIARGLGMDYRINPKFLNAGVGFGGSCLPKDLRALVATAEKQGYTAKLLQEVMSLNEQQKKLLLSKIENEFGPNLTGHLFTIWGLAFKPKTNDLREAPSLDLINALRQRGAQVAVYDPAAMEEIKKIYHNSIFYATSMPFSIKNSSAIILVTEWDEFRNFDFQEVRRDMKHAVIFDGRNVYEPEQIRKAGFTYYGIGRK